MTFNNTWATTFGNAPADNTSRKYGAERIRELKDAIVERMQVDHEFGQEVIGTGVDDQTDSGYHKRVTLLKTTNAEPAAGYTALVAAENLLTYFPEGDSEHTVADLDSTQTLINKTLTSPVITGGTLTGGALSGGTLNSGDALTVTSTELNQLDGVSVGGNASGDILTTNDTQTLTGKTIDGGSGNTIYEARSLWDNARTATDGVRVYVIPIGTWDMDASGTKNVAHTLFDYTRVVGVHVTIRRDDNAIFQLCLAGYVYVGSSTVYLTRTFGGSFDSTSFDDGSNRGYITILYMV